MEKKLTTLDKTTYNEVLNFISKYSGISLDCDFELRQRFLFIDNRTLSSILSSECSVKMKNNYYKVQSKISCLLKAFESTSPSEDSTVLLKIATEKGVAPNSLCRIILVEKYKNLTKAEVIDFLKNPHKIPDAHLANNIRACLCCDIQEGPIVDIIRRCIGEEYEVKLKEMATNAGLAFYDENDLRRTGFDKTPDLKLALPFLYKGEIVNWIESKAMFGDTRTHVKYLREQLTCYTNRFGSGIVIYWFGYLKDIESHPDNPEGLVIADTFPDLSEMEFLNA